MEKLVYLFELDSVRNKNDQMELAMKALFREIIINGNAVAITFNQLIDSRFFLSLMNDPIWSDDVMKLFQHGAIRISQYGQFRTPSQYLLNQALDSGEDYIFSGLPIRSCQKSLIALTKRSLMYSDLTELSEYIDGRRTAGERRTLFREQVITEEDGKPSVAIRETGLNDADMMNTLRDLHAVLNLTLQFSNIRNAYNPPKDFTPKEECLTMEHFLRRVSDFRFPDFFAWTEVASLLKKLLEETDTPNKRSDLLHRLRNEYQKSPQDDHSFDVFALAEAVIDLCYNYSCEASISNVSRHYDLKELRRTDAACETLRADFLARLREYYGDAKWKKKHFMTEESNDFSPYHFKKRRLCSLKRAVHLAEHAALYEKIHSDSTQLLPYEYKLPLQRLRQRCRILWGVGKKLCLTVFFLLVAFLIEKNLAEQLEDKLHEYFQTTLSAGGHRLIAMIVAAFLSAALVELSSSFLGHLLNGKGLDYTRPEENRRKWRLPRIPTFGESLENFVSEAADFACALLSFGFPYANKENGAKLTPCQRENVRQIQYVSRTVKDYKEYRKAAFNDASGGKPSRAWMFRDSDRLPLLNVLQDGEDIRLTRLEEMTGKNFGVVYRSGYHTMLVDPVRRTGLPPEEDADNTVFPYERLVQTANGLGIVSVPVIHRAGKTSFILLRQYRHAIRRDQLGFPRGFGENGLSPERNTQKELWEEIGATLRDPATGAALHYGTDDPSPALFELGRITADSGSLCDTVVFIQAEIASYSVRQGHEGILDCLEVEEETLTRMILSHEIDDGFTVEAFSLWKLWKEQINRENGGSRPADD